MISLSDGISSCSEAKVGAEIACRSITDLLLKKGEHFLNFDEAMISEYVLSHILFELRKYAEEEKKDVYEFSSTVAGVLVDTKSGKMLCYNLGDSIIMAVGSGKCGILAMPSDSQEGCCSTTTLGAKTKATVKLIDNSSFDSVLICSDGAWRQMFDRNKLKKEIFQLLIYNEYDVLKAFLTTQTSFDDVSFISLDMRQTKRRNSA